MAEFPPKDFPTPNFWNFRGPSLHATGILPVLARWFGGRGNRLESCTFDQLSFHRCLSELQIAARYMLSTRPLIHSMST